jgi:two-component system sensor histidine kinase ChiS
MHEASPDELRAELAQLRSRLAELQRDKEDLQREKEDLQVMLEMTTEHSDTVEAQLHDQAQEALRESAERFRIIAEATPVPIVVSRADNGAIVYANARTGEMFGWPEPVSAEPVPLPTRSLLDLLVDPQDWEAIAVALTEQTLVRDYDLQVRRCDGSTLWVATSVQPLTYDRTATWLTVFHDISERKRVEQLKDEFLANTSHELRTPLNGIIGLAESLIEGATGPLPAVTTGNLAMIAASGRRLASLIDDILDFSKLKHQELALQIRPVGMRELTEVVLTLSKPLVQGKPVALVNEIALDVPLVQADENRMQQILYNLIGNAIKFTPEGSVTVSARVVTGDRLWDDLTRSPEWLSHHPRPQLPPSGADENLSDQGYLVIEVADTGIGIPGDRLSRIFDSFEQSDGSTAREYGGTGLGLAVTRQLVALHGGQLQVRSRLGTGTVFSVALRLAETAIAPAPSPAAPALALDSRAAAPQDGASPAIAPPSPAAVPRPLPQSGLLNSLILPPAQSPSGSDAHRDQIKILIVDDEPVNRQVLVNYLSLHDYAIHEATNGTEALAIVERHHPDLILLDVMMPKLTGYEVCRRLRLHYSASELPVVLLTAKNQIADLVAGLEAGANDYLTKPVEKNELLARLKTHLQISKTNQAYGRFVPREFLGCLGRDSIVDVRLGDQVQQDMTVLFSDIRSFTTLSEQMTPAENFAFINGYLGRVSPVIRDHQGFIDKYIGDAIMALFPKSANSGLDAAIATQRQVSVYNQDRRHSGYPPITIGIGLHLGRLMLGTIGDGDRLEGTVIADAVNLASRLEGLTKVYHSPIIISGNLLCNLDNAIDYHEVIRFLGCTQVKGKQNQVPIFEVFATEPDNVRSRKLETRATLEEGILRFHQNRLREARQLFQSILDHFPEDTAAQLYLARCQGDRQRDLQSVWAKLSDL